MTSYYLLDRTIIDLTGLLVTGMGIFAVLTRYPVPGLNEPELSMSFFGHNPFALKRDCVEKTVTIFFTVVALFGFAIQGVSLIIGESFPPKIHEPWVYGSYFLGGAVLCWPATIVLARIAHFISKNVWESKIIESQRESFNIIKEILENDGLRLDQAGSRSSWSEEDLKKYKNANKETVEKRLEQIEKLLELNQREMATIERVGRLSKYFGKQSNPNSC